MLRRFFYFMLIWPIERTLRLIGAIGSNGRALVKALRRGATTNPKSKAPIAFGMTNKEVEELDKVWSTLSEAERKEAWAQYDAELKAAAMAAEQAGKGIWSLTPDEEKRQKALSRTALSYLIWMSIFFGYLAAFVLTLLLGKPTLLFVLMSTCFLAITAPQVMGLRVMRAQLLYGRKITMLEFFTPLPADIREPARHEKQS